mgnify:CR=1 FL=1
MQRIAAGILLLLGAGAWGQEAKGPLAGLPGAPGPHV